MLAASILMLAVVSAVVAFDRWPGAGVEAPPQTLVLDEKAPAIRVSADSTAASATARAPRVTATRGATAGSLPNRDGGAGERITSGTQGAGAPTAVAPTIPTGLPRAPSIPTPENILDPISDPGGAASQIADGAQSLTDSAGRSLADVSPDAGTTVTQAGQTAAGTVRDAPLPAQVIPGR